MSFSSGSRSLFSMLALYAGVMACSALLITNRDRIYAGLADRGFLDHLPGLHKNNGEKQLSAMSAETSGLTVELTAGANGHFFTPADVNGRNIDVLVDTGATTVLLTYEDAERAGIFLNEKDFTLSARTANGTSRIAPITLDRIAIGNILVRNVEAGVAEPGRLHVTLLGMSFMSKLSRTEMSNGRLVLHE